APAGGSGSPCSFRLGSRARRFGARLSGRDRDGLRRAGGGRAGRGRAESGDAGTGSAGRALAPGVVNSRARWRAQHRGHARSRTWYAGPRSVRGSLRARHARRLRGVLRATMDSLSPSTTDLLARDAWLRRLAAAVACDDAHAADLAQETWLRVLRARLQEPLRDVNAWLATLLHNTARNMERGAARRRRRENIVARDRAEAAADPFDLAVYEERRRTLVAAVEALPPAQRDVVVARYWRGFEPAEIARRNGEDPAAVRQRLRRALARLRAGLDDEGRGGRAAWLAPLWIGARRT